MRNLRFPGFLRRVRWFHHGPQGGGDARTRVERIASRGRPPPCGSASRGVHGIIPPSRRRSAGTPRQRHRRVRRTPDTPARAPRPRPSCTRATHPGPVWRPCAGPYARHGHRGSGMNPGRCRRISAGAPRGRWPLPGEPLPPRRLVAEAGIFVGPFRTGIAGKGIAHGISPSTDRSAVDRPAAGTGREIWGPLPDSPPRRPHPTPVRCRGSLVGQGFRLTRDFLYPGGVADFRGSGVGREGDLSIFTPPRLGVCAPKISEARLGSFRGTPPSLGACFRIGLHGEFRWARLA